MIQGPLEFATHNGQQYTIKTPSENEAEAILKMMIEVADQSPYILYTADSFRKITLENEIKWIRESAEDPNSIILGLYQEGRLRGLSDARSYKDIKRKHRACLGIALHPDIRGHGVGTKLMMNLIETAKSFNGIKIIELDVMTRNQVALRLYRKLGFKEAGLFPKAFVLPSGEVSDNLKMYLEV